MKRKYGQDRCIYRTSSVSLLNQIWFSFTIGNASHTYEYRLMNGSTPNEGRLELRRDGGVWGTVKGCLWTGREAQIACLALGFRGHLSPHRCSEKFGSGSGPIHIDLYQCYESTLAECLDAHASEWDEETTEETAINDHTCDIGVICLPGKLRSSLFNISLIS